MTSNLVKKVCALSLAIFVATLVAAVSVSAFDLEEGFEEEVTEGTSSESIYGYPLDYTNWSFDDSTNEGFIPKPTCEKREQ